VNQILKTLVANALKTFDIRITTYSTPKQLVEDCGRERIGVEGADVEGVRACVFNYHLGRATGVLHLGAHLGQEAGAYSVKKKPVIWVEAIPSIYSRLCKKISTIPNQSAFCALLTDRDGGEYTFHISNNDEGVSSSIYEFGKYGNGEASLWPDLDLKMTGHITLSSVRLDTLLKENNVNPSEYDMWVMDLQGAELLALKGAGHLLAYCRSLYVEVSLVEVYRGGAMWRELEGFLSGRGFTPLWQPIWHHDEVLFVR
jgi:FkbM family methyltransferase